MSTHTPGPWELEYDSELGEFTIRMGPAIENPGQYEPQHHLDWGEFYEDADDVHERRQFEEAHANARLIAAAPEMYAALKDAFDTLEMLYHPKDIHRHTYKVELLERARAALASANGSTK